MFSLDSLCVLMGEGGGDGGGGGGHKHLIFSHKEAWEPRIGIEHFIEINAYYQTPLWIFEKY